MAKSSSPNPKKRKTIPPKTVDQLMFDANHTCCICRERGKQIQIHHIDGNPSNNDSSNLVVLCLDCHGEVSITGGPGRQYTPGEIKKYKRNWEYQIKRKRGLLPPTRREKKPPSPIELIISEIMALPDGNKRVLEKISHLYEIHILFGYTREILDSLEHIAFIVGFGSQKTAIEICELVYRLNWHFAGPDLVRLSRGDTTTIKVSILFLGTVGEVSGEFNRSAKLIGTVCDKLIEFAGISLWYDREDFLVDVLKAYRDIKKACSTTYEKGDRKYAPGLRRVDKSLEEIQKDILSERKSWQKAKRYLRQAKKIS